MTPIVPPAAPVPGAAERTRRRRPTMNDVAQLAGVGLKTVSRVVNGEVGVTPEMVIRVRHAIATLGYRPDVGASALRRSDGRSGAIGIALEDVANPFSSAVLRGVEDAARRNGVLVLASSIDSDPGLEREVLIAFVDRRVDGIILMPSTGDLSYLPDEIDPVTPVVAIDRRPRGVDLDLVLTTNALGAQQAVEHLLGHGHRRIAFLGDTVGLSTAGERHGGFVTAMATAGVAIDERMVRRNISGEGQAEATVLSLLSVVPGQRPTAVFAAQNLLTGGAVRALQRLRLHEKVAVVGFDDFPLADLLVPGVTVVAQDPPAMGHEAARLLFDRLDGDDTPAQTVLVPTRLIRRGSGEIRPVDPA